LEPVVIAAVVAENVAVVEVDREITEEDVILLVIRSAEPVILVKV